MKNPLKMMELMRINVILEAKTRIGKRRLEVDGNEFTIFKKHRIKDGCLVGISSIKNNSVMLISADGDKNYNIKFQ
jgi:hypothetical protein